MFPYKNFRHCETKSFRRKIAILSPLSYPKIFDTRNKWNTKGFPYEVFRHCETKKFDGKSWPPPLIQTFSIPEINATVKDSPEEISAVWDEKIRRQILILAPPPVLSINFFATGIFLKHSTEEFTDKVFWYCETKIFDKKSWYNDCS